MTQGTAGLIGEVLQWGSSLLLLLLFARVARSGTHRRMLLTWAAAWTGQFLAGTGPAIKAIALLSGRSGVTTYVMAWLEDAYLPGTLAAMVLIALAMTQNAGRRRSYVTERALVLIAIGVGVLATLLDQNSLTGTLLMVTTAIVFLGGLARLVMTERRLRRPALLMPLAMALFGVVALLYQSIRYFGGTLDPFGDFSSVILVGAGYAYTLVSAVLASAVLIQVIEDEVRARRYIQQLSTDAMVAAEPVPIEPEADGATTDDAEPARVITEREVPPGWIESDEGFGEIRQLPAVTERAPLIRARAATLPRPSKRDDGTPSLVLLVDDEASSRTALARIFQRGGWAVREAATGAEALTWLLDVESDEAPALVVCEFAMSGVGGRELYAHLQRRRPEFLRSLIFVTDGGDDTATTEFIRNTGCQIIERPVTVQHVARAAEQALQEA